MRLHFKRDEGRSEKGHELLWRLLLRYFAAAKRHGILNAPRQLAPRWLASLFSERSTVFEVFNLIK